MIAGLFKTYKEYLESPLWKEKRDWIISCNPECSICKRKNLLLVHHLNYDSVGNESIQDVKVICSYCHETIHEAEDG